MQFSVKSRTLVEGSYPSAVIWPMYSIAVTNWDGELELPLDFWRYSFDDLTDRQNLWNRQSVSLKTVQIFPKNLLKFF